MTENNDILITGREEYLAYYGKEMIMMAKFKVDKSMVLTGIGFVASAVSLVVGAISKKDEHTKTVNEAAEEAAKLVMENMSKKEN